MSKQIAELPLISIASMNRGDLLRQFWIATR